MILLVGESANREPTMQEYISLGVVPHMLLIDLLLSWGAFADGCRYSELGMTWDASMNLLPPGQPWDKSLAQKTAQGVMRYIKPSLVILAGRRVSAAFGVRGGRLPSLSGNLLSLPHPSGRCRCWNDPAVAEECAELWRVAMPLSVRRALTS